MDADLFSLFMSLAKLKGEGGDGQICERIKANPKLLGRTFSQLFKDDPHRSNINVLHVACQEGLMDTIELCLEERPDLIHSKSEANWTPLMNACEAGQVEAIELLLAYDLDQIDYVCDSGSAIHSAITGKDPFKTVSYLLDQKP